MDPLKFSLSDMDGVSHAYEVLIHPASEGQKVMWQLVALGVEPLGRLANGLLATGKIFAMIEVARAKAAADPTAGILAVFGDPAFQAAFQGGVDLGQIGSDVKNAINATAPHVLVKEILRLTSRDGKQLASTLHFDAAYSRNYFELVRATWEVVQANRFLPLPGM